MVKSGIVSFATQEAPEGLIVVDDKAQVSVSKGLVLVDGEMIVITTSAATTSPEESEEVLRQMKQDMETELEKIKEQILNTL